MGLLDDPSQLAAIVGLLQGRQPAGGLLMQYADSIEQRKRAAQQEQMQKLQQEHMQMQMAQQRRQDAMQQREEALAQQFQRPGVQPLTPNDDQGNPMPSSPPSFDWQGYAGAMPSVNPMKALQLQAALQKDESPLKLGKDDRLIDRKTNKEIVSAAPDLNQMVIMGPNGPQLNPLYVQGKKEIAAAGRPQVTVDTRQENEFNKKMGGNFAESYNAILQGGATAANRIQDLNRFSAIIDKIPTGKLEPVKAEVGRLASSLGVKVDTEKLGFQDALESLSNQMALQMRNPSSGAGMPGAMSDKDREFLVSIVPGLSKTPGGNKAIIETFKRVAQREAEVAKLAREYKQKTGKFDEGFYEVLAQKFGGKDLLGDLYAQSAGNANQPQGNVIDFSQLRKR